MALVTTSKAPVTSSDALVSNTVYLLFQPQTRPMGLAYLHQLGWCPTDSPGMEHGSLFFLAATRPSGCGQKMSPNPWKVDLPIAVYSVYLGVHVHTWIIHTNTSTLFQGFRAGSCW